MTKKGNRLGKLPYSPETMSIFNINDKKSQSRDEKSVKFGKTVSDDTLEQIVNTIAQFDNLGEFYRNDEATSHVLSILREAGVIHEKAMSDYRNGTELSGSGQDLIEELLIGKVFSNDAEAVRRLKDFKNMRRMVITAMTEIASNRTLTNGFGLEKELAKAIELAHRAKTSQPDVYADGNSCISIWATGRVI